MVVYDMFVLFEEYLYILRNDIAQKELDIFPFVFTSMLMGVYWLVERNTKAE